MIEYLFDRRNQDVPQILELGNEAQFDASNFMLNLPVKIFVHGWDGTPDTGYSSVKGYFYIKLL